MEVFPLFHLLFWIAMTLAPAGTSEITITGSNQSWSWTKTAEGWKHSKDGSLWSVDGPAAKREKGKEVEVHGLSEYTESFEGYDWAAAPIMTLSDTITLTKEGDQYEYLQDGTERYLISFSKKK